LTVGWAVSAAAKQAYEELLSTAYANLADDEYGEAGAVTVQIGTSADAAKDQASGLAGADKDLAVDSTENLADFTASVQSAASQAAKEGVKAETQYDLARAAAKATYLAALATADKVKARQPDRGRHRDTFSMNVARHGGAFGADRP
jgi:hypothetical protein